MKHQLMKKLLRKTILSLCLAQLAFGPAIALSQSTTTSAQVLQGVTSVAQMGVNIYNQSMMQQMMIQQMQNSARGFTPAIAKQGLVSQCNVPQKPDPMPVKCEQPQGQVPPPLAAQSMASACNAEKALNYLKGALPDGQASSSVTCMNPMSGMPMSTPTDLLPSANYGLKCMDNFRENLALQIQNGVLNDLKRIKSQIAQKLGSAREASKKLISDIEDLNNELNGSQDPDSGIDIASYFEGDAACQLALDQGALSSMNAGGLRGVKEMFGVPRGQNKQPISASARNYINNREGFESDLENTLTKMSEVISELGPEGFLENMNSGGPAFDLNIQEFAAFRTLMGESIKTYNNEKKRVEDKFSELGLQAPKLTDDFDLDSQRLLNSSSFMSNCFNGGTSGTSMSTSDLNFKVRQGFSGGTIEGRVKKRLDEIFANNEMSIETKLSEIRTLDQSIMREGDTPILQISVDINGTPSNVSISDFYQFQQQNCEKKFNTSAESANLTEAKDLLSNLKKVSKSFQSDFSSIAKKIKNCGGSSLRKFPNACADGSALDPASPAFCFDTADRCASSIQSCFKTAENLIEEKKDKRQGLANIYNANMQNLQSIYDSQIIALNKSVSGLQKNLGGLIGVAEVIPEIDRIGILSETKSPFGVDLIDGGSFDRFEKEVPQAIDAVMAAVEQQGQAINDKINDEAQNSELPRINALIAEFEEIKQSCQAVYQKMQADMAQQQQEQQELIKKAVEVCHEARNMFSPKVKPGCGELQSLADKMYEVANVLSSNMMSFANGISNYCEIQEKADSPESESPVGNLSRACSRGGPDGAKKELEALKEKLLGDSSYDDRAKLDPTFADSPQGRAAETIEAALKELETAESRTQSSSRSSTPSGPTPEQQLTAAREEAKQTHQALKIKVEACNDAHEASLAAILEDRGTSLNVPTRTRIAAQLTWGQANSCKNINLSTVPRVSERYQPRSDVALNIAIRDFKNDSNTARGSLSPCGGLSNKLRTCVQNVGNALIKANKECGNEAIGVTPTGNSDSFPDPVEADKFSYCQDSNTVTAELDAYKSAKAKFDLAKERSQNISSAPATTPEITGKICVQLEKAAKQYAFGKSDGSASNMNENGACYENVQVSATNGSTSTTSERKLKNGCDPNEKYSERKNNPTLPILKLIDGAIGMGRNVSGDGASNPYINSMGEHLAGQCHRGETPNPSDITNPFAPQPAYMNNEPRSATIVQ